jgi:hypothetical protein
MFPQSITDIKIRKYPVEKIMSTSYAELYEKSTGEGGVKLVFAAQKGEHKARNLLAMKYDDMIFKLALFFLGEAKFGNP